MARKKNAAAQALNALRNKKLSPERRSELASIAVHPEYRGQGLARVVIEMLLHENPRPLYLMCVSHNGPMYEKFGFQVIADKAMPRYFARIKKLFKLSDVFRRSGQELLVMKLE